MSQIGLIVTINKFKNYFTSNQKTWICETIDEARAKLVEYLADELNKINIDYPTELIDFEYIWFDRQYVNCNAFNYKIFVENNWCEPWESQDIYYDVMDKILEQEYKNPPDFDQMYSEPNPDEDVIDRDDCDYEFEKKMEDIMNKTKNIDLKEEQVKACRCEKCIHE